MALAHRIVSSQTSLVAVDKTPKRPAGEKLTRADIPLNLPAGWDYDSVFGSDNPAVDQRDAQAAFTQLAMLQKPAAIPAQQQVMLPQTATPAEFLMLIAGFLLVFSLILRLAASPASPAADVTCSPQPSLCPSWDRCACRAGPSSFF